MAEENFDIESLAAYLHLAPSQVSRLADRGRLPGRKVGGQWKFSPAEVHHWLEDRIGLSDDELSHVEKVLDHAAAAADEAEVVVAELLPLEAIEVPLAARTRNSVIQGMVDAAARTGWLWDPEKMAEAVRSREELYPTALENGAALLHPRRPMSNILGHGFLALGRTDRGIPFASQRGLLTDVFFLVCSVDDRTHLRTLARLSRLMSRPTFLDDLRTATSAPEAQEAIVRHEQGLLG